MKLKHLYTILLIFLTIEHVFSQWVQTGGPNGTTKINAVFANNHRIYAATSCGLHNTGSLTDKWDLKSTVNIECCILKDHILYFGGTRSGVERLNLSEPGFTPTPFGMGGVTIISLMDEGTCLYACIEGEGFSKSLGYTDQWTVYNTGLPAETINYPPGQGSGSYYVRHVNSIEIIDSTIFCATHEGVYKANKKTLIWSRSGIGLPLENAQFLKVMDGYLLAAVGNRLFFSLDKGQNWSLLFTATSSISTINKLNENFAITTLGSGIYQSSDHGLTWKTMNDGLTDLKVTTLTMIDKTPVCGTETQGVFYFNGTAWVNHSTGIICSDIQAMGISGNSIAANDRNEVFLSNGLVNTWATIYPSTNKAYLGFINTMGNRIFLSYKDTDDGQFIKYSEDNKTWQDLKGALPFAGDDPYKMRTNGNRLYIYENEWIYDTDDLGATWNNLTYADQYCNDIYDLAIYKNIPFSASCGNGELLRLSDNKKWGLSNNGLPNASVITSMAYSKDAFYAYSYLNGMYVSRDDGRNWTKATNGLYTDWNIRSFASYKDLLFVSTVKGVYYTTDYGQNWTQMNEGLKNSNTGPLVIFKDTLYLGTRGNGVWKHDLMDFIPPEEDSTVQMMHIKIFPNPTTETLRFDFPGFDKAQIRLIDLLGREMIKTKLGADKQISVAGLSSGTYIVIITTEQYVYNSKVIIKRKE